MTDADELRDGKGAVFVPGLAAGPGQGGQPNLAVAPAGEVSVRNFTHKIALANLDPSAAKNVIGRRGVKE